MRRYLSERDALPGRSLVGGVLTSLHATMEGTAAAEGGNVISFIFADLATDTDDIAERAARVRASTRAGKDHLLGLGHDAMTYSTLMLTPLIASMAVGQGHRMLPMHNIGLSNVPGIDRPAYYNGAEVEALHATTIIAHGQAAIVTVASWNGTLCFTLTSCPDSVPHPQRIAVYLGEALEQVESALLPAKANRA